MYCWQIKGKNGNPEKNFYTARNRKSMANIKSKNNHSHKITDHGANHNPKNVSMHHAMCDI